DIFETDFEIPALDDDSASEAIAIDEADTDLESSSDFDLAIDESSSDLEVDEESGSQVVVLDDETEPPARSRKSGKKKRSKRAADEDDEGGVALSEDSEGFDDMELDEDGMSASAALQGVKDDDEDDEDRDVVERVVEVHSAPWGMLPALVLLPTVFIVFIGGIMGYELVTSMWGYHQTSAPASLVVDNVAEMLDMKTKVTEK
ncbi:MAG: hypothetical protein K8T89_03745, partial [Planctomycetes bacterium]|nr:hypothetical protein [Planctomycetota bacterium]